MRFTLVESALVLAGILALFGFAQGAEENGTVRLVERLKALKPKLYDALEEKDLPQFKVLDLSHSRATSADLGSLKLLPALTELNLNSTHVDDSAMQSLKDSGLQLKKLDIGFSQITPQSAPLVGEQKQLESLNLSYLPWDDAAVACVKELTKLRELDLSYMPFKDAGLGSLASLTELRRLDLEFVPITTKGLEHLKDLTKIEYLNLAMTNIRGEESIKPLAHMTRMKELSIRITTNHEESLKYLTDMPSLEKLNIRMTNIGDLSADSLLQLKALVELDASDTVFSDKSAEVFKQLTRLKKLNIIQSRFTKEGALALKKEMTNCEVLINPWWSKGK